MKAQSNTQKTVRNQVSKMVLVGSAAIFFLVITNWSVKAMDLQDQFLPTYNFTKMAMYFNEQASESKQVEVASPANNEEEIQIALPVEDYNAKEFVDPEMDREIGNWKDNRIETPNEDAVTESELQIQGYNAMEITDAEMKLEIEKWVTNENLINEAEAMTAKEADAEIEKYAQRLIHMEQNQTKYSVAMTDEEFFKSAEEETAQEAELQIEKYASLQIAQLENNGKMLIAGNGNQK